MKNKSLNLPSNYKELSEIFEKICLREISFKYILEITKGWSPNRQLKLLEDREAKVRENQATIQAIEEKWNQKEHNMTSSRSQGVLENLNFAVALHHSESII
ncbi:hypothetical protein O181_001528 [Austropuccinia psidii MF-1]|uniref:Uncharacterized protein n=1 Tax=Austropuccinia psidii MF-1 TaxID=1389203 RepID=A0A9Q3GBT1_9BASI|nr:hypothetical protein [Austropuccinia psidii MF-1]